ncbi:1-deoxy-D-xylulose-5-phosphate synthase [Candidatus Kinetoplastibacterium desouzaii TCC079E]|uniref:1-deoxy-D-xylulose-5-phosphate synthase n=1 Tax=Candidatus Kinetoplastidibacterium desouzai TCC079E TaxID=1208919 RepID=M1M3W2_9PROT|nr:1-deoxy-D-xylulose-5-phosphate synthase [Candidatus Kinetoplastibacterium desouzaii]AGF46930.1 1-deoxy-D-xylulose-5-phosphate synthase [Candidatus Kinetoplastibacterium desouzaii TCC079E]
MPKLLDNINLPSDLRELPSDLLKKVANELRMEVLNLVSNTGGHLSSSLGVIELTIALHYVFNTPDDVLIWDVGHQSYPHKILTGRKDRMFTIRQRHGISGFPKRSESLYDSFGTAHSSTSISAALGMACAARKKGNLDRKHIAVIGDGAISSGMAFEALNNAGVMDDINLLVILNDNHMSISPPVGALNRYFTYLMQGRFYAAVDNKVKKEFLHTNQDIKINNDNEFSIKNSVVSKTFFEEFGFNYSGPIDGHDINLLVSYFQNLKSNYGLNFLHIVTKKGKGYDLAEKDPILYHGLGKFNLQTGIISANKKELKKTFSQIFGCWICDMANEDSNLIGVTPAMREGSGLVDFGEFFPDRYFDVGISEQHAVTFAAGMACDDLKPVVAIYSTFLQRAYDQLIHDVAIQNLDVTFAIDRSGLVGADGATHSGNYDISFLRCIPNLIIATPSDENEQRLLLTTCYKYKGPSAVRYPRGEVIGVNVSIKLDTVKIGYGIVRRLGKNIVILGFGTLVNNAMIVANKKDFTVADMRFVKPLDENLIISLAKNHNAIVTLEDNAILGGAGSAVLEVLNKNNFQIPVLQLGIPDRFIDQGDLKQLNHEIGLDPEGIESSIISTFKNLYV